MKLILKLAALAFILTTPSIAEELNCQNTDDLPQVALSGCAWKDFQAADKQLNNLWKAVKQHAEELDKLNSSVDVETTASKDLLTGQRGWIKYRDGHCDVIAAHFAGGTIQPQMLSECKAKLTRVRIQEFLELMRDG